MEENRSSWKDILNPSPILRSMLIVGIGVSIFQQTSGIEAVTYYSPEILQASGPKDPRYLIYATVLFGIVKVVFILIATFLADRVGRRPLLLTSAFGLSIALFSLMFASRGGPLSWGLSIFSISLHTASYSIGFGPVTWVLCSEVFPSPIRGRGMSISMFTNRIFSGAIAMTFLSVSEAISPAGTFLLYGGISLISLIWVYYYVPETKGRPLEQIEEEFKRHNERTSKCCQPSFMYLPIR
jgi:MFS family permease